MAHGDITHIDIPVSDPARASDFYGALFGWDIQEIPGYEGYPMWQAPNKISGGGLAPRGDGLEAPRSYVEVDSIDEALARAAERGGRTLLPRSEIDATSWYAVLEDPDGNPIGLYESQAAGDDA